MTDLRRLLLHRLLPFVLGFSAVFAIGLAEAVQHPAPFLTFTRQTRRAPWPPSLSLDPSTLTAQAAIVYDPTTGRVLFEKNAELQLPLASVTKLMTAQAVLSRATPQTPVRITAQDVMTEGDSRLAPGQTWTLDELLRYGLLVSSNDALAAAAAGAGGQAVIAGMNEQAQELGMAQSYFLDPTGLDLTTTTSGGYSSARDVALLTAAFAKEHPTFFETTADPLMPLSGGGKTFIAGSLATAAPIIDIPGLVGAKTGYTDLAGGNLTAVFDIDLGHPLIGVVLHSTEAGRFSDMRALIEAARKAAASTSTSL